MIPMAGKTKWIIGFGILLLILGWFGLRIYNRQKDANNLANTLRPDESEAVIVDPLYKRITLITKDHVKTFTLPDRPSRISVLKLDGIKIDSPQYGTEFRPFLGAAYTLNGGVVLGGLDVFYWKKMDLELGVALDPHLVQHTTAFFGFSYLAYSNCSVGLGMDTKTNPILFVKVRL